MESGAVSCCQLRDLGDPGDPGDGLLTIVLFSPSLSRALLAVKSPTISSLRLRAVTDPPLQLPAFARSPTPNFSPRRVRRSLHRHRALCRAQEAVQNLYRLLAIFDADLLPNIASYNSVSLPFLPRTDSIYLRSMTQVAMPAGKFAKVC